jgi:hypothetical protein
MSTNPLQKYFRQPKVFLSLPSKGLFYKENSLSGDYNNVPIFGMTGMDEILMKTPDALFNGESTVKVIESCCPSIKDGKSVPSLDTDALLIAIRIATYGEELNLSHTCKNCGTENNYEVNLTAILDLYQQKSFDNKLKIEDLTVVFRPLNYEESTKFSLENFKLQKMLVQITEATTEEDKQKYIDDIYARLAEIQVDVFLASIESIHTATEIVSDKEHIKEWLTNSASQSYKQIKNKLDELKKQWAIPPMTVKCDSCGTENSIEVVLDQSNFFVTP